MLTPSKGLCTWPAIVSGGSTPSTSRMVGTRSMAWWYCSRSSPPAADPLRPRDDARVRGAAVELVALPHLERRVERHRPAVRVVVVGLRAAELVEHRQVLSMSSGMPLENLFSLTDPFGAALTAGAVVGDQDHQRVLALAGLLEVVQQPPDLRVDMREEAGVDLGHAAEQPLLLGRQRVPRARLRPAPGTARRSVPSASRACRSG